MPLPPDQAWFPLKTFGWGWGWPRRWEGWVVFVVYLAGLLAGTLLISRSLTYFLIYNAALSTGLISICWWKGETPQRRWGPQDRPPHNK